MFAGLPTATGLPASGLRSPDKEKVMRHRKLVFGLALCVALTTAVAPLQAAGEGGAVVSRLPLKNLSEYHVVMPEQRNAIRAKAK